MQPINSDDIYWRFDYNIYSLPHTQTHMTTRNCEGLLPPLDIELAVMTYTDDSTEIFILGHSHDDQKLWRSPPPLSTLNYQWWHILTTRLKYLFYATQTHMTTRNCEGPLPPFVDIELEAGESVRTSFSRSFIKLTHSSVYLHHRVGSVLSFFSSRRNWGSPKPSPAPPFGSGGEGHGTLAGERGVGRVPIPTRAHHTPWYSVLCDLNSYK